MGISGLGGSTSCSSVPHEAEDSFSKGSPSMSSSTSFESGISSSVFSWLTRLRPPFCANHLPQRTFPCLKVIRRSAFPSAVKRLQMVYRVGNVARDLDQSVCQSGRLGASVLSSRPGHRDVQHGINRDRDVRLSRRLIRVSGLFLFGISFR